MTVGAAEGGAGGWKALAGKRNTSWFSGISKKNPVVIIGETMGRVEKVADELASQGYKVQTYDPIKKRSSPGNIDLLDIEANRSWLKYWTSKKNATVVDIGIDSGRSVRSPFYSLENRSVYKNWEYKNVLQHDPGF
ncbi:hypothetical protein [Leptospira wolffii]|uniref:hypothetical protein n=1 Tax=Leptospira wolffii TaxID=409998 RepID=UPI000353B8FB|nr:hypothetical protein [Leptospira wolffii]EPG66319.1 hypothetical protein LEP1GSC061_3957 [Leptospira wolffii serovar Khorat str. Khorat-H2]